MRALLIASLYTLGVGLASCGPSTIRVVGVMRQSSEMRPLPAVPLGGYQQLRLLVRAASGQSSGRYGSLDCGFARVEGADEGFNNAACVPLETLNTAVGIVRQRLRSYGVSVVRDASDPYDYVVEVFVAGQAPRKPDRTLVRAFARVALLRQSNAQGNTVAGSIDWNAAAGAFDSASRNCGFERADDLSWLSASNAQPMTPDFDIVALAGGAVDNLLRCYELANFFLVAPTRFPKTINPQAPPPGSPQGPPSL